MVGKRLGHLRCCRGKGMHSVILCICSNDAEKVMCMMMKIVELMLAGAALLSFLLLLLPRTALGCRWAVYAGDRDAPASTLLTSPSHSLCKQAVEPAYVPDWENQRLFTPESTSARNHDVNLDGWGFAYYDDEGRVVRKRSGNAAAADGETDPEILDISENVRSKVMFGHIRAATDGDASDLDSHPFTFNNIVFMHNGGISGKEKLRASISCERAKSLIDGHTDSEIAGAVFANHLVGDVCKRDTFSKKELEDAMIFMLDSVSACDESTPGSSLNFAASDGRHVIATRYRNCLKDEPPSLYYRKLEHGLFVASEPLQLEEAKEWTMLAKDQLLSYDSKSSELSLRCLTQACEEELLHRAWQRVHLSGVFLSCISLAIAAFVVFRIRSIVKHHYIHRKRLH